MFHLLFVVVFSCKHKKDPNNLPGMNIITIKEPQTNQNIIGPSRLCEVFQTPNV